MNDKHIDTMYILLTTYNGIWLFCARLFVVSNRDCRLCYIRTHWLQIPKASSVASTTTVNNFKLLVQLLIFDRQFQFLYIHNFCSECKWISLEFECVLSSFIEKSWQIFDQIKLNRIFSDANINKIQTFLVKMFITFHISQAKAIMGIIV